MKRFLVQTKIINNDYGSYYKFYGEDGKDVTGLVVIDENGQVIKGLRQVEKFGIHSIKSAKELLEERKKMDEYISGNSDYKRESKVLFVDVTITHHNKYAI